MNGFTLDDVEMIYEPEILRYLFVGTKPKTGFQISFDNDVIKIYDEFDKLEREYFEAKTYKILDDFEELSKHDATINQRIKNVKDAFEKKARIFKRDR